MSADLTKQIRSLLIQQCGGKPSIEHAHAAIGALAICLAGVFGGTYNLPQAATCELARSVIVGMTRFAESAGSN